MGAEGFPGPPKLNRLSASTFLNFSQVVSVKTSTTDLSPSKGAAKCSRTLELGCRKRLYDTELVCSQGAYDRTSRLRYPHARQFRPGAAITRRPCVRYRCGVVVIFMESNIHTFLLSCRPRFIPNMPSCHRSPRSCHSVHSYLQPYLSLINDPSILGKPIRQELVLHSRCCHRCRCCSRCSRSLWSSRGLSCNSTVAVLLFGWP